MEDIEDIEMEMEPPSPTGMMAVSVMMADANDGDNDDVYNEDKLSADLRAMKLSEDFLQGFIGVLQRVVTHHDSPCDMSAICVLF